MGVLPCLLLPLFAHSVADLTCSSRYLPVCLPGRLVAAWNFAEASFEDGGAVPDITGGHNGRFSFRYF